MTMSPAVQAEGLNVYRRRTPVLMDLDFRIPAGSITGLFGPSGCGKTTLMRTMTGLQHYSGGLQVLGRPATPRYGAGSATSPSPPASTRN